MYQDKKVLLLDMNSTFMFGEDRFDDEQDFSEYYRSIGGKLPSEFINESILKIVDYLSVIYPKEEFRHCFPSLEEAIDTCLTHEIDAQDKNRIIETFSFHEHGEIPNSYVQCLQLLRDRFDLALVADIWAPKERWVSSFRKSGIWDLFSAYSFSSDHGMVKPSPRPFEMIIDSLEVAKESCLVVGDSIRRDLDGARAAGLDCVLVGTKKSEMAVECFSTLLEFQQKVARVS